MTPAEILDRLKSAYPDAVVDAKTEGVLDPFVKIAPAKIAEAALFLRNDPAMRFDYLMCLSGVDYTKGVLGVVYHLASMDHRHKITLKVDVPAENPGLPSVTSVWAGANWHEREAFDLYGIVFSGHPDLRRILLPDDWEGHPLRKDYKVPEFYQGMKVPY